MHRSINYMHAALVLVPALVTVSCSGNVDRLCDDRAAIERVYYEHRLGNKPAFAEAMPPSLVEELVRKDLRKETALKWVYGVEITPEMLAAEVTRINTTTRAPEMLAEIKAALDKDPVRFANAFAKPFLVERLLRQKFENDDALHAAQRNEMETVRERLLAAREDGASVAELREVLEENHASQLSETTRQLGARPAETEVRSNPEELEIKKRFGPDAQVLSSPYRADGDRKHYFEDLPGELQNVLRAQLRQAGDVSAVIETPSGFLLYLVQEKDAERLRVSTLSVPKRDYGAWVNEQDVDGR